MSNVLNLSINQGSTFHRVLTLKTNETTPMNLTGCVLRGQIRPGYNASKLTASFSFTIRDQGSETGVADMTLAPTALVDLKLTAATAYFYDVELVDSGGTVTRIMEGKATINPEVTK